MDRTDIATLVVDRNGGLLFANHLAEIVLRQDVGLRVTGDRLIATDRAAAIRLLRLIRSAADAVAGAFAARPGGAITLGRGEGRLPLTALVTPFRPRSDGFGAPMATALIFVRDPETSSLAPLVLRELFGFTPAQAVVAACLADGGTLESIAAKLRISVHTAREHLKAIFAKTGTSRQAQLVALLLRSVANLSDL